METQSKAQLKNYLRQVGLQTDFRNGNLQHYQRLVQLYQTANNKGFNKKKFRQHDLEENIRKYDEKRVGDDVPPFATDVLDDDVRIYTNKILQRNLAAEVMTTLTFQFPTGYLELNKASFIMDRIKTIINLTLDVIVNRFQFYLKFEFDIVLIDIDTGERVSRTFPFPDRVLSVNQHSDFNSVVQGLNGLFTGLEEAPLREDTKKKLHEVKSMTLKIAKNHFGGCSNYKTPRELKGKPCVLQPAREDNLCFWRCLAIAFYLGSSPDIGEHTSKAQREKALALKKAFYDKVEVGEAERLDTVNLAQIPTIARELGFDVQVFTPTKVGDKLQATRLVDQRTPEAGAERKLIMLHYDSEKSHFALLNTLTGYGGVLSCPECNRVFDYSKGSRLDRHLLKHQAPVKELTFKKKEVRPKVPFFEQVFDLPLIRDLYFGFDFEAILEPADTALVGGTQRLVNVHRPIAFVLQCSDSKYETIRYCGADAAKVFIEKLDDLQKRVIDDLRAQLHFKYRKQISDLKRQHCKCPPPQPQAQLDNGAKLPKHKKDCEFNIKMATIYKEFLQIPIIGFNSGKYDMTFIISHMLKGEITDLITKSGSYMKLKYGSWSFLDCRNYVPPGINLSRFAQMWGVREQKEIMCYNWFDNIAKLDYTELPPIDAFHNELRGEVCSDADYAAAQNNWTKWGCATFRDYMMKYCEIDVEIMMQGLLNYRRVYLEENKIELLNHVSLPQTAYTTFLRLYHDSKLYPLFTIPDSKTFQVINKSIFGGNCQVFKRYAALGEGGVTYLAGLDENNLYGWAGRKPLPYGDSEFLDDRIFCERLQTTFLATAGLNGLSP